MKTCIIIQGLTVKVFILHGYHSMEKPEMEFGK